MFFQICNFTFMNWIYSDQAVNLTYDKAADEEMVSFCARNSEWDIISHQAAHAKIVYHDNASYAQVVFKLHLKRLVTM